MTRRTAVVIALVLLLSGCGVDAQGRPDALVLPETPSSTRADDVPSGTADVHVYLVRGTRLEPVVRSATADDLQTALEALVAGPQRREVLGGLRTAITPETRTTLTTLPDDTVQIDLPRELTGLTGSNQLLAFAQLVWTLTDVPRVDAIRFTSAGAPVEVPTDGGLTGEPVSRADYASVGPLSATQPSGTD